MSRYIGLSTAIAIVSLARIILHVIKN